MNLGAASRIIRPVVMGRARRSSEGANVADDTMVDPRIGRLAFEADAARPRSGIAPRVWLLDRFRDGRSRKLTLVCAPAGYGKTTVLAQWCEVDRQRMPFGWMSAG